MEAWLACCTKHFLRVAARIAGGDEQARDALQESWIRVSQHVREYSGGPPACAWVRSIVVNCAHDVRKADSRTVELPDSAPDPADPAAGPEDLTRQKQMHILLDAMIEKLEPAFREVVELRYGQELSTKETAARLHVAPATVASRLSRAVKKLREGLAKRIQDDSSTPPPSGGTPS